MCPADSPLRYDMATFTIREMTYCGRRMRGLGEGAVSMEEVACRVVRHLHDSLVDGEGGPRACCLVRFFKTHPFGGLDGHLQRFALGLMGGGAPSPEMKCLTLLGTAGDEPEWNRRCASRAHQAIPLPSEAAVQNIPMLRNVLAQLGLAVSAVVRPDPALVLDLEPRTYNVFLVPDALGSKYIPAQEGFVVPHRVRSVLGFGGMLPSADVFMVILFLRIPISRETADLFKHLSLSVKLALLPFEGAVFAPAAAAP